MAIIIEQEKKGINWFSLALILSLVLIIGATAYYFFFSSVPYIEKVLPQRLQSIKTISTSDFRPDTITNNPTFQTLKQYVNAIEIPPQATERPNPFSPF